MMAAAAAERKEQSCCFTIINRGRYTDHKFEKVGIANQNEWASKNTLVSEHSKSSRAPLPSAHLTFRLTTSLESFFASERDPAAG
jgi:hypothetical protein